MWFFSSSHFKTPSQIVETIGRRPSSAKVMGSVSRSPYKCSVFGFYALLRIPAFFKNPKD